MQMHRIVKHLINRILPSKFSCLEKYDANGFCLNILTSASNWPKNYIDKRIFVLWTGNNDLTPNRKAALESLKENSCVNIQLITPNNLNEFIVPGFPIHPAYQYLSLNHRSDYLRCYLMHFYGGGYTDIKKCNSTWINAFNSLINSKYYGIGYPEISPVGVANTPDLNLNNLLKENYSKLIGNGAFIFKPLTVFTFEWFSEVNKRLDFYYSLLKRNPGNTWGDNKGYPMHWTELQGEIFHPLCFKYNEFLLQSAEITPSFEHYR